MNGEQLDNSNFLQKNAARLLSSRVHESSDSRGGIFYNFDLGKHYRNVPIIISVKAHAGCRGIISTFFQKVAMLVDQGCQTQIRGRAQNLKLGQSQGPALIFTEIIFLQLEQ